MAKKCVYFVGVLALLTLQVSSQTATRNPALLAQNTRKKCSELVNGKLLNNPQPVYPLEAKIAGISGKVEVVVEIDKTGRVIAAETISGIDSLKKAASQAALQAKFSPSLCDGNPTANKGVITFNFPKIPLTGEYFKPAPTANFNDVTTDKNYSEAVVVLTTDYQIAFGYLDQKFHGEMPLTRGDFVHFLRQTLEMLDARGTLLQKPIKEIGLFREYNPYQLNKFELVQNSPFAESVNILSNKFGIILAEKDGKFAGDAPLKKVEVVRLWRSIFGDESIPIHFLVEADSDQEMSRGEFAIYLKESLDVLSYKVSP